MNKREKKEGIDLEEPACEKENVKERAAAYTGRSTVAASSLVFHLHCVMLCWVHTVAKVGEVPNLTRCPVCVDMKSELTLVTSCSTSH